MKIRKDFVTNSSSSSFVLAFNDKDDGISQIISLFGRYEAEPVCELLSDFIDSITTPYEGIANRYRHEFEDDAYLALCYGDGYSWWAEKETCENTWLKEHPDSSRIDFLRSDEYKQEMERLVNEYADEFVKDIGDRRYLVHLEYGDSDEVGSQLEYKILPNCDFTVRRFSHH